MKYLAILLLFFSAMAYAQQDQLVVDGGLGDFSTKGASVPEVKFAKFGYQEDLWYTLKQRLNIGGWLDGRGLGYSSSGFVGYQLGFEIKNSVFEGSIFGGPSLINQTDQDLGGILEFNESVFFGIVDQDEDAIGLDYNHFSDAGLENGPNIGKDFMGIAIKFPLELF